MEGVGDGQRLEAAVAPDVHRGRESALSVLVVDAGGRQHLKVVAARHVSRGGRESAGPARAVIRARHATRV